MDNLGFNYKHTEDFSSSPEHPCQLRVPSSLQFNGSGGTFPIG